MHYPIATRELWVKEVYDKINGVLGFSSFSNILKELINQKRDISKFEIICEKDIVSNNTIYNIYFNFSAIDSKGVELETYCAKVAYSKSFKREAVLDSFMPVFKWLSENDGIASFYNITEQGDIKAA